jgi:hypothetical protein
VDLILASHLETARVSHGAALSWWKMQPPLLVEGPPDSGGSALEQRISYPFERPQKLLIDASEVTITSRQRI